MKGTEVDRMTSAFIRGVERHLEALASLIEDEDQSNEIRDLATLVSEARYDWEISRGIDELSKFNNAESRAMVLVALNNRSE